MQILIYGFVIMKGHHTLYKKKVSKSRGLVNFESKIADARLWQNGKIHQKIFKIIKKLEIHCNVLNVSHYTNFYEMLNCT